MNKDTLREVHVVTKARCARLLVKERLLVEALLVGLALGAHRSRSAARRGGRAGVVAPVLRRRRWRSSSRSADALKEEVQSFREFRTIQVNFAWFLKKLFISVL